VDIMAPAEKSARLIEETHEVQAATAAGSHRQRKRSITAKKTNWKLACMEQ